MTESSGSDTLVGGAPVRVPKILYVATPTWFLPDYGASRRNGTPLEIVLADLDVAASDISSLAGIQLFRFLVALPVALGVQVALNRWDTALALLAGMTICLPFAAAMGVLGVLKWFVRRLDPTGLRRALVLVPWLSVALGLGIPLLLPVIFP
jgi:hypothetical protein